jgi:hypothetical protein
MHDLIAIKYTVLEQLCLRSAIHAYAAGDPHLGRLRG